MLRPSEEVGVVGEAQVVGRLLLGCGARTIRRIGTRGIVEGGLRRALGCFACCASVECLGVGSARRLILAGLGSGNGRSGASIGRTQICLTVLLYQPEPLFPEYAVWA